MIQAILFDLDGTLLDRDTALDLFVKDHHERYKLGDVPFERYIQRFRELDAHGYGDKHKLFQMLIAEFSIQATPEELLADFRKNFSKWCSTFPQTLPILQHLRSQGYKLGIITNGSMEAQKSKLIGSGLTAYIDIILISEEEGIKKPDPQIFIRAAERVQVSLEECLFIGDNPQADIAGAQNVGMKTIWIQNQLPWPKGLSVVPNHKIHQLTELLTLDFAG